MLKSEVDNPEIQVQITQLKALMASGDESQPSLHQAWKLYGNITEAISTSHPIDRVNLAHIRAYIEAINRGGVHELNSTYSSANFHLKDDTVGLSEQYPGRLFGQLEQADREKVTSFYEKMITAVIAPSK